MIKNVYPYLDGEWWDNKWYGNSLFLFYIFPLLFFILVSLFFLSYFLLFLNFHLNAFKIIKLSCLLALLTYFLEYLNIKLFRFFFIVLSITTFLTITHHCFAHISFWIFDNSSITYCKVWHMIKMEVIKFSCK